MDVPDPTHEPGPAQDAALIARARTGERAALRSLVDDHLPAITRFAFRMLGDASEAEDVAQETFLRLWRALDQWEPRARLSAWLHRVAHNLCIDRLRARRQVRLGDDDEVPDPQQGAVAQLESLQRSDAVAKALGLLPERQRAAVTLVYHQGLSNREAAEVLGVQVDALESLLSRGRQGLRKLLAAHMASA